MGDCWIITDEFKRTNLENRLYHKKWENNTPGIAEVMVLLKLVTVIAKKSKHITQGKIVIGYDHRKSYSKIIKNIKKTSEYVQEAGAKIAMIKRELEKIKFNVESKYIKSHDKIKGTWRQEPLLHLIKECDSKAREIRETIKEKVGNTNIKYFGYYTLSMNGNIIGRSTKEAIRVIDAKKKEEEYAKEKFKEKYDFVDVEARNIFSNCTTSMIKCSNRYNHYGLRDALINDNMIEAICPRCCQIET